MHGSAPAAAFVVLLLTGCLAAPGSSSSDGPTSSGDGPSRTARGDGFDEDDDDERPLVTLGAASGGVTPPGTYPLPLQVPAGGATEVQWRLDVVPVAALELDGVQGPGCRHTGWFSGVTASGTTGECSDLAEGQHEWSFSLNLPVESFQVQVFGRVEDPVDPSSNATER